VLTELGMMVMGDDLAGVKVALAADPGSAFARSAAMVDVLVAAGLDVNDRDSAGITPLHRAAQGADFGMTKHLLGLGADPLAVNDSSRTAFASQVSRNGQQQLSLRVNDPTPSNNFPLGLALPQIHNRRFPSIAIDGQVVDETVTVTTTNIEIANTQMGSGSIVLSEGLEAFRPTNVTGGYLLDVAFTVTGATLVDSSS
jgi:ankyrin repeat protein